LNIIRQFFIWRQEYESHDENNTVALPENILMEPPVSNKTLGSTKKRLEKELTSMHEDVAVSCF